MLACSRTSFLLGPTSCKCVRRFRWRSYALNLVFIYRKYETELNPTVYFAIIKSQNPSIDVSELHKEASLSWNVRSGSPSGLSSVLLIRSWASINWPQSITLETATIIFKWMTEKENIYYYNKRSYFSTHQGLTIFEAIKVRSITALKIYRKAEGFAPY